jgi:hypothetical protein
MAAEKHETVSAAGWVPCLRGTVRPRHGAAKIRASAALRLVRDAGLGVGRWLGRTPWHGFPPLRIDVSWGTMSLLTSAREKWC